MNFIKMKSNLGKRKFIVIEEFTWCEKKYLTWFRGFVYAESKKRHMAKIAAYDNMQVNYIDKHQILFKPVGRVLDLKDSL